MTKRLEQAVAELEAESTRVDPADIPALVVRLAAIMATAGAHLALSAHLPANEAVRLLTLQDAASLLGKSPAWLRRKAAAGALPCARRIGRSWRFSATELERYVARMRHVG